MKSSPTFTFDGIEETLQLVERKYSDNSNSWSFIFQFDSRHPGYGDRNGQILVELITPHQVVIVTNYDGVKSAVMDGKWDLIKQQIVNEETVMADTTTNPVPYDSDLEDLVDQAKEDLSIRLSISSQQIGVIEANTVVWPDASIGCPQPDMRYKQVPVDGVLIRLQAGGKVYEYHSGGTRSLFLCEQPLELQKDVTPQIDLVPPDPSD
ncbi:MAG TPA: hypothetical protein G4O15_01895 [Dehalococcoidia bacterium]|nr:hypothetical protein [Dehalococcoidia bacterium]